LKAYTTAKLLRSPHYFKFFPSTFKFIDSGSVQMTINPVLYSYRHQFG